jgi:maltooligosyltrehalose trehalohydrolase
MVDRAHRYAPTFGALPEYGGARFQVWAPNAVTIDVVLAHDERESYPLRRSAHGLFTGHVAGLAAGAEYWYRLDGAARFPDPATRFQAHGVHGPSTIVDASAFPWSDAGWRGVRLSDLIVYELHVGTFTPDGTFRGVESKLDALVDLGVTALELMPIAECAGRWNWGYDGVDLFAPSHNYGTPDDLRRLVNAAHARGLAVIVDVVYNHLGPDGAYVYAFSPQFRTDRHQTPWGAGVNLDGEHSDLVRRFLIESGLHWIHEYHADGLRIDACHTMQDDSPRHFLSELTATVRASVAGREVLIVAEDERNDAGLVTEHERGGYGCDAVWADDFHHHVRRATAGDCEGYYCSYSGKTADIAETLRTGWFYTGQFCEHQNAPRGTVPIDVPLARFVICLQNHDQVGNRGLGERLHHQIDLATYRAASALLLMSPETPLLFMGQEWAASSPFLFFTDHEKAIGQAVTKGRRLEFASFSAFADPESRIRIPDPQDPATFRRSRLDWHERTRAPHASILRLYRALLRLRKAIGRASGHFEILAVDDATLVMVRSSAAVSVMVAVRLRGDGEVALVRRAVGDATDWRVVLTTEDAPFAADSRPPEIDTRDGLRIRFARSSAVVLTRGVEWSELEGVLPSANAVR